MPNLAVEHVQFGAVMLPIWCDACPIWQGYIPHLGEHTAHLRRVHYPLRRAHCPFGRGKTGRYFKKLWKQFYPRLWAESRLCGENFGKFSGEVFVEESPDLPTMRRGNVRSVKWTTTVRIVTLTE